VLAGSEYTIATTPLFLSDKMITRRSSGVQWTCWILPHFQAFFPGQSPGQAGFEFFLLPSRIQARPHATNANRWAARLIQEIGDA